MHITIDINIGTNMDKKKKLYICMYDRVLFKMQSKFLICI